MGQRRWEAATCSGKTSGGRKSRLADGKAIGREAAERAAHLATQERGEAEEHHWSL